MSKPDGGPAFPHDANRTFDAGMSLRDWFAGQALAGISAHLTGPTCKAGMTNAENHARWSYSVADAMLKARA